jgi:predicted HicB family RNase H-like nuclease
MAEKKTTKTNPQKSIRISFEVANAAKHRALDEGRSWSELVEQAIAEYLRRQPGAKR